MEKAPSYRPDEIDTSILKAFWQVVPIDHACSLHKVFAEFNKAGIHLDEASFLDRVAILREHWFLSSLGTNARDCNRSRIQEAWDHPQDAQLHLALL